jgi:hypothetical protein
MADRYTALIRRALDDGNGDRGDVAEPAIHMPRSMSSRCELCGKDMSVRDSGNVCQEHADDTMPKSHEVQRPGGSTTKPRPPMTKDGGDGQPQALDDVEMGGPGSGPHGGGGKSPAQEAWAKAGAQGKHGIGRVAAVVKDAVKTIGHGIVDQYRPSKQVATNKGDSGGWKSRNEQNGPEPGVDYIVSRERRKK